MVTCISKTLTKTSLLVLGAYSFKLSSEQQNLKVEKRLLRRIEVALP